MSSDRKDHDRLGSVFAEVNRETSEHTPDFASMWQRAEKERESRVGPRRRYSAAALATAAASLLIAAGLVGIRGLNEPETGREAEVSEIAASLSSWQAPLDFLLRTPGSEWLETTPRLAVGSTPIFDLPDSKETRE